jgi:wyosine [tRNA(Phe)-imidazoG37] synthetase (radical SAM superfamily)
MVEHSTLQTGAVVPLHTRHERVFEGQRFVYPVLSRRSGGISVGVNLNPDKVCNFDCIYCQVDRRIPGETRFVGLPDLLRELEWTLRLAASGEIFETSKFRETPGTYRRVNDIAFSGDGEPTTHRNFDEVVEACAALKRRLGLSDVKMVLITNASMFHRPHVQRGLEVLDSNQGEIWAKLDAGTDAYFKRIDRTPISLGRIIENIIEASCVRPLVIQSLFMKVAGEGPDGAEIDAYCAQLQRIMAAGGKLRLVQAYTVARRPAEDYVSPLTNDELDAIAEKVRQQTGIDAMCFYGVVN